MASTQDTEHELLPEQTEGYKVGEKKTMDEINKMDEHDESLRKYKENLLGTQGRDLSDPNDPRHCIILSLTMQPTPEPNTAPRPPVTVDLSTPGSEKTLKDKPFKIKEGGKFTLTAKFKVQHQILSGLHYVQVVKTAKTRIRVSKDQEMLGSFAPNTDKKEYHEQTFAEVEAPSGMLARGKYTAQSSFVDDDKKRHLEFEWAFEIGKDW